MTKVMHYVDYVAIAARRVFQAIPSQANGLLLPIAGFCSGFMDFVNSSIDLGSALKSWNSSTNIGDGEGQRRAGARCAQNTFSIPASIGSSIQYIVHLVPHVAPQAVAIVTGAILGYVLSSLYGVVALVGIGLGALGIYRNSTFRSNLNAGDRAGDVWKQDEEIVKTLKFLQNKIGVTADASDALETAGESNPSDDKLNQKKFEYVKRRTSEDVAKRLQAAATVDKDGQSEIGDWIRALNNSVDLGFSPKAVERDKWRDATRKAAIELINDVKKANRDNTRIQLFSLVVSILSFVGILLMSLSTAGVLPLSLLGIASVISMGRLWHRL
ncbi:MAG TPA: hypothetical protein VLE95_03660 [Chlamydiales bacterium]|nr:hypothetical protein [Chlamydiales bacterium]